MAVGPRSVATTQPSLTDNGYIYQVMTLYTDCYFFSPHDFRSSYYFSRVFTNCLFSKIHSNTINLFYT